MMGIITDGWTHGDPRALMATGGAFVLLMMMSIKLIVYFWKKDKKIRFYKSCIVRTNGMIKLDLEAVREAYVIKLNITDKELPKRKRLGVFLFISIVVIGPLAVIPVNIGIFILGLFHGRVAFYTNMLLLIEKDKHTAVTFPLAVIHKNEYKQIDSYLQDYFGLGVKEFQRGLILIPEKAVPNIPFKGMHNECSTI